MQGKQTKMLPPEEVKNIVSWIMVVGTKPSSERCFS